VRRVVVLHSEHAALDALACAHSGAQDRREELGRCGD
jgi:hypothetical protein